jgi:hypothetical protein
MPALPVARRNGSKRWRRFLGRGGCRSRALPQLRCAFGLRTCWFCLPCEIECPEEALYVEVPIFFDER